MDILNKLLIVLSIMIAFGSHSQQNFITNGGFENSSIQSPSRDGQLDFLDDWESRLVEIDADGTPGPELLLHSPDWKQSGIIFSTLVGKAAVGPYTGNNYVGMGNYELIQQKWDNNGIIEHQPMVASMYIYLSDNIAAYDWQQSELKVVLSKNRLRYSEENSGAMQCSPDFINYDNNPNNYIVVGTVDLDPTTHPQTNGWVRVTVPFKAPFDISDYDWFGIELGMKNYNGSNSPSETCQDGYVWIDDVRLERAEFCHSPCSPNLGPITHTTLPNVIFANQTPWVILVENAIGIDFYVHPIGSHGNYFYHQWAFDPDGLKDIGAPDYLFGWVGFDDDTGIFPGDLFPDDVYVYTLHIWNCDPGQDIWYQQQPLAYAQGTGNTVQGYDIQDFELEPCCDPFAVFNFEIWNSTYRKDVEDFILCDGFCQITPTGKVTLAAENQISFLPGFNTQPGGQLDAYLQSCRYGPRNGQIARDRSQYAEALEMINKSSKANVFPNPTIDGNVTIKWSEQQESEIRVYNTAGQLLLTLPNGRHNQLDLSGYEKGVYYLEISTELKTWTEKLIIQ